MKHDGGASWMIPAGLICLALAGAVPATAQDAKTEPTFEDTVRSYMEMEATEETCGEVQIDLIVDAFKFWPELGRSLIELAEDPTDPRRHHRTGVLYARGGAPRLATVAFTCATRLDRTFVAAWNNLGILRMSQHDYQGAQKALLQATRLDPTYARGHYNLAMAYDAMDSYDDALASYERALTLDPRLATSKYNPQVAQNPHRVALFLKKLLEERTLVGGGLDENP